MKKTVWILLVCMVIFSGCKRYSNRTVTEVDYICSDMVPVRNYTIACIDGAGKGGDAEPEDWLSDCEQLAKRMFCKKAYFEVHQKKFNNRWVPLSRERIVSIKMKTTEL